MSRNPGRGCAEAMRMAMASDDDRDDRDDLDQRLAPARGCGCSLRSPGLGNHGCGHPFAGVVGGWTGELTGSVSADPATTWGMACVEQSAQEAE